MTAGGEAATAALEGRLGHTFEDRSLLATALTHPSAPSARGTEYQRLEFLGDQVLGLVITEALFDAFPTASEGELSRRRAALVRKEACAEIALDLGLPALIRMGGGSSRNATHTTNILGDVTEAVIAALYLDGGLEAARRFILVHWRDRISRSHGARRDAKSALQEWAQGNGIGTPAYEIVARSGPDHAPRFAVEVKAGELPPVRGEGGSRRDAEHDAAIAMLVRQGVWKDGDGR